MASLRILKSRYLAPVSLVGAVGLVGLLAFMPGAGASGSGGPGSGGSVSGGVASGGGVGAGNFASGISLPPALSDPLNQIGPVNTGTGHSTIRVRGTIAGKKTLLAYGDQDIYYTAPSSSAQIFAGKLLFAQQCSSCHSPDAQGSAVAPDLVGVGPATVMFWVTTGRMPATQVNTSQAQRKLPRLSYTQAEEVAGWVNSLDASAPYIPTVNLQGANLADGADLFSLNCAACHTITGAGDALAFNTFSPSLHAATPQQVAEAIRTGPANMPRFSGNLTDRQVRDLVAYVTEKIQHPDNAGGAGLGGIGPVAEGFVGLLLGVGILALICFWIGDRSAA